MDSTADILTGRSTSHLEKLGGSGPLVHREMAAAYLRLSTAANQAGFELRIVSSFRDFATQLRIWNEKARGKRPVLDEKARPLDVGRLDPQSLMLAILRWSALPGASRHHWGTDIDVVDAKATPKGYRVQLIPEEVEAGGMFAPLHDWLDGNMKAYGFFRPYAEDRGGVSPERWHLSYAPVATRYLDAFTLTVMERAVAEEEMELKETVLQNARAIHERFVRNISAP